MSTRGAVAIRQEGPVENGIPAWRGVYMHHDSYPPSLGKHLWDHLQELMLVDGDGALFEFSRELLKWGDWREYLNGGICEYCGKKAGQPHSIGGGIGYPQLGPGGAYKSADEMRAYFRQLPAWQGREAEIDEMVRGEEEITATVERTGYPDPEARHHQHGEGPADQFTNEQADPLSIEWVYVVNPLERTVTVLANMSKPGFVATGEIRYEPVVDDEGWADYGHCCYRHEVVAVFSLDGPEPDWEAIRRPGREED